MGRKGGLDNFFNMGKGYKFIAIPHEIVLSCTWKQLSRKARISYVNILACYNGRNYDHIICPRKDLILPLGTNSWLEGTTELDKVGLITVLRRFGLNNCPNIYGLSNEWKKKEREMHNK